MNNLKKLREARGLTQEELSRISGVNRRGIEHYEQGYRDLNKASVDKVLSLAKALHCKIEDLLDD